MTDEEDDAAGARLTSCRHSQLKASTSPTHLRGRPYDGSYICCSAALAEEEEEISGQVQNSNNQRQTPGKSVD